MTMEPALTAPPSQSRLILLEEIRHKWNRLSEQELSALRNSNDLVMLLQAQYGLSKTYAGWEVDSLMKCRTF